VRPYYEDEQATIYNGDCREILQALPDDSVDAVVTDPPYGLAFMGKRWDYDVPDVEVWAECLRVLKPGGHLLAFAGTRTQHRMAVRIEDAGFEIRDMIAWVYGSGFPKSLDVSKAIDKAAGAEREVVGSKKSGIASSHSTFGDDNWKGIGQEQYNITAPATPEAKQWSGWGTALKPALEPITVARKPLCGTVAENVLQYGTGGLNVDGCRVEAEERPLIQNAGKPDPRGEGFSGKFGSAAAGITTLGRWPANLIHDGSDEVVGLFPSEDGEKSEARFFYTAKADKTDRGHGNNHPTVKPQALMRYLVRLVCPLGGVVLDPFGGSGTTAAAARLEQCRSILCELSAEYCDIAVERLRQRVLF
jgi:DNA modification methylase